MSTQAAPSRPESGSVAEPRGNRGIDWSDLAPEKVQYADSLSEAASRAIWQKIYIAAHVSGEKEQAMLRSATYLYMLVNGTSREGSYEGDLMMKNGTRVPAGIIVQSTGKTSIRRFFRANMDESYDALKAMDLSVSAPRHVAKVAAMGISADAAFAVADWLGDCKKFLPNESLAYERSFNFNIRRAAKARGNSSLEAVEYKRAEASLAAQDNSGGSEGTGRVDF